MVTADRENRVTVRRGAWLPSRAATVIELLHSAAMIGPCCAKPSTIC
jgi:hypothetical protein